MPRNDVKRKSKVEAPEVGESYFLRCERDSTGHCLPEGTNKDKKPKKTPSSQESTSPPANSTDDSSSKQDNDQQESGEARIMLGITTPTVWIERDGDVYRRDQDGSEIKLDIGEDINAFIKEAIKKFGLLKVRDSNGAWGIPISDGAQLPKLEKDESGTFLKPTGSVDEK